MDLDLGDTRLILSQCWANGLSEAETAYVLATAHWETNRTMLPVEEAYWLSEDWRKKNLRYYPWHGRGYVQLTWERNYKRVKTELGIDVVSDPSVALQSRVAAAILVTGMQKGWFTGKKLSDFISKGKADYVGARKIINGNDKAQAIAVLADKYLAAIQGMNTRPTPVSQDDGPNFIVAVLQQLFALLANILGKR